MYSRAAAAYRDYLMDCVEYVSNTCDSYGTCGARPGQAAVNVLADWLDTDEVDDILAVADPFYDDAMLPAFYTEVEYAFRARYDAIA